jgi:hypothetical protein
MAGPSRFWEGRKQWANLVQTGWEGAHPLPLLSYACLRNIRTKLHVQDRLHVCTAIARTLTDRSRPHALASSLHVEKNAIILFMCWWNSRCHILPPSDFAGAQMLN